VIFRQCAGRQAWHLILQVHGHIIALKIHLKACNSDTGKPLANNFSDLHRVKNHAFK
jgi:hypothetical protein